MRRLLFVSDELPYPLDRGSHVRIHNLLQACAQDFEITFLAPCGSKQDGPQLPAFISHAVLFDPEGPVPCGLSLRLEAYRLQIGLTLGHNHRLRLRMLQALKGLDLSDFDLIFAERPVVGALFKAQRSHTVVDFDDLEHRKIARRLRVCKTLRAQLLDAYRYMLYRHADCRTFRKYAGVLVCSNEDQQALQAAGMRNVRVLGNGADVPSHQPILRDRRPGEPLRVVFLGNMRNNPNLDAIEDFLENVLPRAKPLVERFDVIGAGASPQLIRRYAGRVNFLGFAPALGAALANYDVMVAPLRYGSGTKLKVLDGMAHGIPLVISHCAAEGLELTDGQSALIADSQEQTVGALARLAATPALAATLATVAFRLVSSRFSWQRMRWLLRQELQAACSNQPRANSIGSPPFGR